MNYYKTKLALGSANFGLDYGINNPKGRVSEKTLRHILKTAKDAGIFLIDTAQTYGDSEKRLGKFNELEFAFVTKIFLEVNNHNILYPTIDTIKKSLHALNVEKLEGVLLHRPEVLFEHGSQFIINDLNFLKEQKILKKIGVSIYSPNILEEICKILIPDIVQVPFNIFDNRIIESGWAKRLKDLDVEIHGRSTFLQGLLLIENNKIPCKIKDRWPNLFQNWNKLQNDMKLTPVEASLNYSLQQTWLDKIIVGIDNEYQLRKLIQIEKKEYPSKIPGLSIKDEMLLNPYNWNLL